MTNYIVASAVRELAGDFRVSGEFLEALDTAVEDIVEAAIERAQENGRATVRPYDVDPEVKGKEEPKLVRKSAVAELVKENEARISGETYDVLNAYVMTLVEKAKKSAEANGRKTLKACDVF